MAKDIILAADLGGEVLSAEQLADLDQLTAPAVPYPNWFAARVTDVPVRDALLGAAAVKVVGQ